MNPLYVSLSALFFALSFLSVQRGSVGVSSLCLVSGYIFMFAFSVHALYELGGLVIKVFGGVG